MSEYVESKLEISSITEHLYGKNHWSPLYSQTLYQKVQSSLRWQLHKSAGSKSNKWSFNSIYYLSNFLQLSKYLRIQFHRGQCCRDSALERINMTECKDLGQGHSIASSSRFLSYLREWHLAVVPCTGALNSKIRKT